MSTLIFFIILSIIIIVHEFGHFIVARRCGVKVEIFSLGFGPKLISKKIKETEFRICLILFGGYVKMAGDNRDEFKGMPWEYLSQPISNKIKIVFSGALLNYISAFLFLWLVFFLGYPTMSTKVGVIKENCPAERAGIMVDDEIVKVDKKETKTWPELQKAIESKIGRDIELTIKREGKLMGINITPYVEEGKNLLGEKKEVARIGIMPKEELIFIRHNIIESLVLGFKELLYLTLTTYKSICYMVIGKMSVKEVTGVVGIFHITEGVVRFGFIAVVHLMAIISMSLAIINLLPFPVLDGGHIFFLLLEKIRRRPLSRKAEDIINQTGVVVLVCLIILITMNDFTRFGYWEKIAKLLFK